jgi:hypothetical protein
LSITAEHQITEDAKYIRRRALETGLDLRLRVSRSGFTISAYVGEQSAGSSSFFTERPTDPIADGHFRLSVDMAIANATRKS